MVDQDELLKAVEEQEAANQRNHYSRSVDSVFMCQCKAFRQHLEADHGEQNVSGEAKQVVQPVAVPEGKQAAAQSRSKRRQ